MAKLKNTKALLVLGMHRSGTSALTGTLNLLGIDVGSSLLPANKDVNPKGFWEHAGVVDLHERLLDSLGSSWCDERSLPDKWWLRPEVQSFRRELVQILSADFADAAVWAVKDPRMCRLMPLWQQVLLDLGCSPRVVIILRDPREVAKSLAVRDGVAEEKSALLWLQYLLAAEKWTRGYSRVIVTFEGLLEDWCGVVGEIESALDLQLNSRDAEVKKQVSSFLEPSLRHHAFVEPSSGLVTTLALTAYKAFAELHEPERLKTSLEQIEFQLSSWAELIAPWAEEVQALKDELHDRSIAMNELSCEMVRVRNSLSWRITAPLRGVWNLIVRIFSIGMMRP